MTINVAPSSSSSLSGGGNGNNNGNNGGGDNSSSAMSQNHLQSPSPMVLSSGGNTNTIPAITTTSTTTSHQHHHHYHPSPGYVANDSVSSHTSPNVSRVYSNSNNNNNNNSNNNNNNNIGSSSRGNSRTNSPVSQLTTPAGNGNGGNNHTEIHSNAVAKHTFTYGSETIEIRNVWAENVEEEMAVIRELVETHPYVAMDTEFPGVVARPVSETFTTDFHYKSLKVNVDLLKIIQLGLSFADQNGNFAKGCPCWQFNFKFSLNDDMFAQDSIDLLVKSGISFEDHSCRGIDPSRFGELLMVSGLVLDDRVRWVSFHSGYDYGYLLKLLTCQDLPTNEKDFFDTLRLYFPTIYDIKFMTSLCDGHFGGLQKLADALGCRRIGMEHQAGSDSLLTMSTYFALARAKFSSPPSPPSNGSGNTTNTSSNNGTSGSSSSSTGNDDTATGKKNSEIDDSKYKNELYGYGTNHTARRGNVSSMGGHLNPPMHQSSSGALSLLNGDA
eukprot:CAMPEP_0184863424 /NCGR_PEP_ID=MMETSP0580-20130426/11045_1 /TAXON_ID=1118495 /ORGANISM="Dactyliosolen fragilissimus" /LENGTH=497 /DNA_ID=CAMNT_0027361743 /DNA_START=292 /DNA_END=1781 /DNA_ORIENTATION=+